MPQPMESEVEPILDRESGCRRRRLARFIFCVATCVVILDVIPPDWPGFTRPKLLLSEILNRVGLWQGQWTMFAPDPVLTNASLSAEFEHADGKITYWVSPDWKRVGTFEKFYRFRYLNFFNRVHLDNNARALKDFADFISRNESKSPVVRLKIHRNSMTMLAPDDGRLPNRNDAIWVSRSDFLTERRYDP